MAKFNSIELSKVYVDPQENYRLDSDYGTEEELVQMGRDILNGGVDKMDAIVVVPTKRDGFEYEAIAGFTRCLSLRTQPGWEEFNVPIRIESEKTSQAERIRINLASNIHRTPNAWSDANALEKLEKLGLKGKKLKAHMPGKSDAQVSQLRQLVSCSEEVREAGRKGLIKPTLVLALIAANGKKPAKTSNSPENDADGKPIDYQLSWEALQGTIAAQIDKNGKVTAVDFAKILNTPKPLTAEQLAQVEEEKKKLVAKTAEEERIKSASGSYTKLYESLSKLLSGITPDNRKQFSDLLAGIKAPTDGAATTEELLKAYQTAGEEVIALTSTVNEWLGEQRKIAEAQAMQAGLDKQNAEQGKVDQSKTVTSNGVQTTPPADTTTANKLSATTEATSDKGTSDKGEVLTGNDASNSNHGSMEEASREVLIGQLFNVVSDGIQSALGCKARNETVRIQMIVTALTALQSKVNVFRGKLGL